MTKEPHHMSLPWAPKDHEIVATATLEYYEEALSKLESACNLLEAEGFLCALELRQFLKNKPR